MKRKQFLYKSLLGILGTALLGGLYAWQIEPFWLEFVRRKMPIRHLPGDLDGKVLMQISDLHVGNRFDYRYLIQSLEKAKAYDPDFVVYTGDYVTYESEEQLEQLEKVLQHAVKGKHGTVGILGNHDYGEGWSHQSVADQIAVRLDKAGIQLLRNEQVEMEGLNIIGFDDYWGLNFGPEEMMKAHKPDKANLVLCHNPDVCDLDVWYDYQGWILSGHTHGGQIKPPFLTSPTLPVKNKRYSSGEIDLYDGRTLYINRALGHIIQVRFNVRPEITVFELEVG